MEAKLNRGARDIFMKQIVWNTFRGSWLVGIIFMGGLVLPGAICAAEPGYKDLGGGVQYQEAGEFSIERLNKILTTELAEFSNFKVKYPAAKNAVKLYRVIYTTVIPEKDNQPATVSGLIAIPQNATGNLPVVSYQHGTVFSRTEVPSMIEQSSETRLMIANFAAHGYVVIAADYIGKGISKEPEAYIVPGATAQACYDMLQASRAIMADLGIKTGDLFLSGWSQGSYNTLVFLEKLEAQGVEVKAATMASTPNDIYLLLNKWMNVSSKLDVQWLLGTVSILIHSYEEYYGMPGLSQAAIKPEYWQACNDLYTNKITWEEAAKILPQKTSDLLQEEFRTNAAFAKRPFFRQLRDNADYHWRAKTPTRFYYGEIDEVIPPYVATLPVKYQEVMEGAKSEAVFAGSKANHHGTFLFGINDQKKWFDQIIKK